MILLILKALHVISVMIWMAVLLYMPRLFIYQTNANSKPEPERSILINQYKIMSKNLWIKVGWPAMILTIFFGLGIMHPYFSSIWFWVKLALVAALIGYHHIIHFANKNLQKDSYTKTINQLNTINQAGVVFLLSIVLLAVLKNKLDYILIFGGLAVLILVVFIGGRALIKKSAKK
jgi:putative membrane protein